MIIADRKIGVDHEPFVIAELGLNHAGHLDCAIAMVDAAKRAGASAAKLQTHETDEFCDTPAFPGNAGGESIQDFVRRCSLSQELERAVFEHARQVGIICLSTPFSPMAVDRLERLGVPAYKAGSGQLRDLPLLRLLAATGKPVILSTGMGTIDDIHRALCVFPESSELAVLACTSEYPTPYEHVRLGTVEELQRETGLPVGLSCHSVGIWAALGAVALGACVLEKHFAVPACPPGPDLEVSINEAELAALVVGSRAIWQARGGTKGVLPGEAETLAWFQTSRRTT